MTLPPSPEPVRGPCRLGWLLPFALALVPLLPHAGERTASPPAAVDLPCVERRPVGAEGQPAPPSPQVPGLHYTCRMTSDGQALFVGQAAPAQATPDTPVVLLIHGLGQNAHTDWAEPVQALAQHFRVVAVDLPGFGASPTPAGAYAFDTLGRELAELVSQVAPDRRVHVVGHSLGAAVALHFAHRHARQVDRLVLVDAAGILLKPVFMRHMTSLPSPSTGLPPLDDLLRRAGGRLRDLSAYVFLGQDGRYDVLPWLALNPGVRKALLGGMVQTDAAIALVEHDFSEAIRETAAPTTLIWGQNDRIAPLRTGRLLAARMPQAQLRTMAGVGHTPMVERPGEFNRLVLDALTGALPTPSRPGPGTAATDQPSQGDVVCRSQDHVHYSGRFDSLTLQGCRQVLIENAQIGRLVLSDAQALLDNSSVVGREVAVDARNSELIGTGSRIRGRIALRAENSWFDLAGVSLQASEQAMEARDPQSRAFFSVSDWVAPQYRGDAHFMWPRTPAAPAASASSAASTSGR